jgi:hydrogenase maturation factor
VTPGTYVLVHTGFVIQVLDRDEALETLRLWDEVLEHSRG